MLVFFSYVSYFNHRTILLYNFLLFILIFLFFNFNICYLSQSNKTIFFSLLINWLNEINHIEQLLSILLWAQLYFKFVIQVKHDIINFKNDVLF